MWFISYTSIDAQSKNNSDRYWFEYLGGSNIKNLEVKLHTPQL